MAYEYIELNLIPTGEKPVFHAAQYDVGRPIIIKLKNGEDDFTPTGLDLELQVRKVDNNIVTAVPDSVDGNVVTFFSTQQMTACSGTNLCEVQLSDGSTTIATLHFYLVVQRDVLQGGLTSQSEIHDLEEQIAAIVPEVIGDEYYTAEEVDEKIAEIPTFDPSNYYDKTQLYTKTETNGLLSQKANTSSLATVATSGSYNDLLNKPTIPDVSNYYTKLETYNQTEVNNLLSTKADTSSLSTVATTGDYDDLLNKPTIPTDATLLPISSSDPTNTKDYIDSGLSGKADISTPTQNLSCPRCPIQSFDNYKIQRIGNIIHFSVQLTFGNTSESGYAYFTSALIDSSDFVMGSFFDDIADVGYQIYKGLGTSLWIKNANVGIAGADLKNKTRMFLNLIIFKAT